MKNKRGQFYLVTVVLLIGLFVGVILLQNDYRKERNVSLEDLEKEISLEKNKLLDHIAYNDLTPAESSSLFSQFANEYIAKVSSVKNIIFIFGDSIGFDIVGEVKEDNIFSIDNGVDITELDSGAILMNEASPSKISILVEGAEYNFPITTTQNIYYIIRHDYNNEVYIISG